MPPTTSVASASPHACINGGVFFVALVSALTLTVAFLPGYMSFDSLQQYRQAIGTLPLVDSHPVIMVYLWREMLHLINHPGVMLAFHQLIFWTAIALFACAATRRQGLQVALLVMIGFWPPLVILSLHLWKDAGMMGALAMAAAALLMDSQQPGWRWLLLGIVAIFYAVAIRINGLIAAFPLICLLSHRAASRIRPGRTWRRPLTAALIVLFLTAQFGAMRAINSKAIHSFDLGTLMVWDISAVSLTTQSNLIPPYLATSVEKSEVMTQLATAFSAEANYPGYAVVSPYPSEAFQRQLIADWGRVIFHHPRAYIGHRFHVFEVLLGINRDSIYYPFHPGIDDNEFGFTFLTMTDREAWERKLLFDDIAHWFLYRPWPYCIALVGVLILISARRVRKQTLTDKEQFAATIAASGLLAAGSLLVIAPAADYRYMIWTIFSALLSTTAFGFSLTDREKSLPTLCNGTPKSLVQ